MTRCPYCQSGRIAVEPGSSPTYPCPDCDGVARGKSVWRGDDSIRFLSRDCDDLDDFEPNGAAQTRRT